MKAQSPKRESPERQQGIKGKKDRTKSFARGRKPHGGRRPYGKRVRTLTGGKRGHGKLDSQKKTTGLAQKIWDQKVTSTWDSNAPGGSNGGPSGGEKG